jgi:hypothetical protein
MGDLAMVTRSSEMKHHILCFLGDTVAVAAKRRARQGQRAALHLGWWRWRWAARTQGARPRPRALAEGRFGARHFHAKSFHLVGLTKFRGARSWLWLATERGAPALLWANAGR